MFSFQFILFGLCYQHTFNEAFQDQCYIFYTDSDCMLLRSLLDYCFPEVGEHCPTPKAKGNISPTEENNVWQILNEESLQNRHSFNILPTAVAKQGA